jgi:hypothetical protein
MLGGPGTLRFILQPAIAIVLGTVNGVRDRQRGRSPYGVDLARGQVRVSEALRAIALPALIAVIASLAFQWIILERPRLVYALAYALLFVALPYFAARGLANRAARLRSV